MPKFQAPRGTRDILPEQQLEWEFLLATAKHTAEGLGFGRITVPTYESLGLFERSIGQGTDVMDKELFLARGVRTEFGKEEYALRPEGTAGIVRAFIEHGLQGQPQPVRLWSIVNNFRYDRPQRGRLREHTQFDIEIFGDAGSFSDALTIFTTWKFLTSCGLTNAVVQVNTLGTSAERKSFAKALVEFLTPHHDELSEDSQARLVSNPLRILDSKSADDQALLVDAPKLQDFLLDESKNHFEEVLARLQEWGVPHSVNTSIVRGLDYYSHTCFEWTIPDDEGQQSSLGGGGRYDGLVAELGGMNSGAVGAGIGLERVELARERQGLTITTSDKKRIAVIAEREDQQQILASLTPYIQKSDASFLLNWHKLDTRDQATLAAKQHATHNLQKQGEVYILRDLDKQTREEFSSLQQCLDTLWL